MPPSFHHCPEMPMNKGFSGWKEPSFHSFHPSFHPEMPMDRAFQHIGGRMEGDFSNSMGRRKYLLHEGKVHRYEGMNSIPKALAKRKNVDI
jgi:hypothetical protein